MSDRYSGARPSPIASDAPRALGGQRGFTIVELLVVVVVIAILAGITVVAFDNIQQRAASARVIATVDAYSKALKIYHIQNGRFPSYGTTWGACLGGTAQYPATADFPAGACTRYTNSMGSVSHDYASDNFNNEIKTVLSSMPDVTLKIAKEDYGGGASTMYRGIYYEHQNNSGGTYPDWAYVEYVVSGKVPCPNAYSTRYKADGNVTFCSNLIVAGDTGVD